MQKHASAARRTDRYSAHPGTHLRRTHLPVVNLPSESAYRLIVLVELPVERVGQSTLALPDDDWAKSPIRFLDVHLLLQVIHDDLLVIAVPRHRGMTRSASERSA